MTPEAIDAAAPAPEQDPKVWQGIAGQYTRYVHPVTAAYADDVVRLAGLEPGDQLLDVACGAGAVAMPAAKEGANVLATDIAPSFVELVKQRAQDEGLRNLSAAVMDGQALKLPDASFDAATSNFGVFLFPDRAAGFREMRRVLRPTGRAVVTTFFGPPDNEWMALMRSAAMQTFPDAPPPQPPKFMELADPDRLKQELNDAGFSQVALQTCRHETRWPDAETAWTALTKGVPVFHPLLARVGADGAARLRSTFVSLAKERFGPDGMVRLAALAHGAVARP